MIVGNLDFRNDEGETFATKMLDGSPIAFDLSHNSGSLLIAFAGASHRFGLPNDEAVNFFNRLETNIMFLRDPRKLYGFGGFPGIGNDVDGVTQFLRAIVEDRKIENLVVTGTSAGGFLSILFGVLVGADTIHAFMPMTSVKLSHRYRDKFRPPGKKLGWMWRFLRIGLIGRNSPQYLDMQRLLDEQLDFRGKIYVHFNQRNKRDVFHAKRIEKFSQIKLRSYTGKMHNVVPSLLDSGELEKIFAPLFTK